MATVILARHGRTTANSAGLLAGRLRGVRLDDVGREQAEQAQQRLLRVPLARAVSSPQERCKQTARMLMAGAEGRPRLETLRGLSECDYGDWQGKKLKDLAREKLWRTVQEQPSAARFPGGESLAQMQARGVAAIRETDAAVSAESGEDSVWLACSHGDVIKAIVADALGVHLDLFQRLHIDPASLTIIRYTETRPMVLGVNTHAGPLDWLAPARSKRGRKRARSGDGAVGGGAGPGRLR